MRRDYPGCPKCETDVYVDRCSTLNDFRCNLCDTTFDASRIDNPDGRRPEWVISR